MSTELIASRSMDWVAALVEPVRRSSLRLFGVCVTCGLIMAELTACGHAEKPAPVGVALIIKTSTNPFFVAIEQGVERRVAAYGMTLTVSSGKQDGDVDSQIAAIDAAIARGDKAIMITPSGPAVDGALRRARQAGIAVAALDTKPSDPSVADMTFATDNFEAGRLIGSWAAAKMSGRPVVIAMLDLFVNRSVESDFNRDQGFLEGMGIPLADPTTNGDEAPKGEYSGGAYTIACHQPTMGAKDGGRTAMQQCLHDNPAINLVYTINEPAASGAIEALQAARTTATLVSVDGGCDPGMKLVKAGLIGATAQQYPREMATKAVDAIAAYLKDGTQPIPNAGIDMITTGVALVTNDPQAGVPSIDVAEGMTKCWDPTGTQAEQAR